MQFMPLVLVLEIRGHLWIFSIRHQVVFIVRGILYYQHELCTLN